MKIKDVTFAGIYLATSPKDKERDPEFFKDSKGSYVVVVYGQAPFFKHLILINSIFREISVDEDLLELDDKSLNTLPWLN